MSSIVSPLYVRYHSTKHRRDLSEDVIQGRIIPHDCIRSHNQGTRTPKVTLQCSRKSKLPSLSRVIFNIIEPVFSRKWCEQVQVVKSWSTGDVYILKVRLTRTKVHSETIEHIARSERVHPVASCSIEEEYSIDFRGAGNEDGEHHWLPILVILIPCMWRCHDLRLSFHSVYAWSTACSRRRSRRMGHQGAPYRRKE